MDGKFIPAKLLISVVPRSCGKIFVEVTKRGGARGGTIIFGKSFGPLNATDSPKDPDRDPDKAPQPKDTDIILTLTNDRVEEILNEAVLAALQDPAHLNGFLFLLDVPQMLARLGSPKPQDTEEQPHEAHGEAMKSGNVLITSIINHGEGTKVMSVAREAGARGGTILNARGTGTEEDVQFFGISLAPEKEMLMIVAGATEAEPILSAISAIPSFNTPGGGIVFTLQVDQFIVLGS